MQGVGERSSGEVADGAVLAVAGGLRPWLGLFIIFEMLVDVFFVLVLVVFEAAGGLCAAGRVGLVAGPGGVLDLEDPRQPKKGLFAPDRRLVSNTDYGADLHLRLIPVRGLPVLDDCFLPPPIGMGVGNFNLSEAFLS